MAFLAKTDVSQGQLISGIIGTVDIGNLVGQSITLQDDINRSQTVIDRIKAFTKANIPKCSITATELANYDGLKLVNWAKTYLPAYLDFVNDSSRNQTIQSAGGYRITSAMLGQEIKIYTSLQQMSLLTKALFDFPESIANIRLQKYYNKLCSPNEPSERDFFLLCQLGVRPFTDLVKLYQEDFGFNVKDATNLADIRQKQIGKPSLSDAFFMVQKGLKPISFFYDLAKIGQGWSDADAKVLYQHYQYTFSPMEIFRISDLTPVPTTWVDSKLSALGFSADDKTLVANMIANRTLKDEVTQTWNILLDNYSWGLLTEEDLTDFLTENKVPEIQANAKLVIANLQRQKVILKLMRDAEIYLYRKDVLSEDLLLTHLQDLNIGLDVANAITRNEAAKKGIDWEMPP